MPETVRLDHRRALVALSLALVYVVWGSTYLALRYGLEGFPPFLMNGFRLLGAGGALAVIGQAPPRWFTHVGPRTPLRTRLFVRLLRQTARLRGVTLPGTTYVPLGDEAQILEWVAGAGPRGILTTPSLALRLALQAQRSGRRLDGLTFITIAEPYGSYPCSSARDHCTRTGRSGRARATCRATSR